MNYILTIGSEKCLNDPVTYKEVHLRSMNMCTDTYRQTHTALGFQPSRKQKSLSIISRLS